VRGDRDDCHQRDRGFAVGVRAVVGLAHKAPLLMLSIIVCSLGLQSLGETHCSRDVVAVQFGYVGLRLWERFGKTGLLMIGLLGAINIPFYEEMARRIHWWKYSGCRMISYTPCYTIVGEFGIALVFALLARALRRGSWEVAVLTGLTAGASIFWLLRSCLSDYRSIDSLGQVKSATLVLIFILLAVNAGVVQAVNPIRLVRQPLSNGEAIKLNEQAQEQIKKDDLTGAARTIQLAMQKDPTLWLTYFTRARLAACESLILATHKSIGLPIILAHEQ